MIRSAHVSCSRRGPGRKTPAPYLNPVDVMPDPAVAARTSGRGGNARSGTGFRKGDRVSPRSVGRTVLARVWMPLVAVVAVGVGAVGHVEGARVLRSRRLSPPSMARKHLRSSVPNSSPMSCSAPPGTAGCSSVSDIDGHPHRVDLTTLPWSHTETTTLTVVSGSISAQVHGGQIGCRIRVNGVVRDEQSDDPSGCARACA